MVDPQLDFVKNHLVKLGFNPTEAGIYLSLLESGPISISQLAKQTQIPRTTIRENIAKLLNKGMVSQVIYRSSKKISAESPEKLKLRIENQKIELLKRNKDVEILESQFEVVLRTIEKLIPHREDNAGVRVSYFEGKKAVRKVYADILNSGVIYSFVNFKKVVEIFPENIKLFKEALDSNPKMELWEIIDDSPVTRNIMGSIFQPGVPKNVHYQFIPRNHAFSDVNILLYDNKVAIINLDFRNLSAIVIDSAAIFSTIKAIHQLVWNWQKKDVS